MTRPHRPAGEKPLHWIGSSRKDLQAFPDEVVDNVGFALARAVYVLHVFQKKSPTGIRTALRDVRLIEERLKVAQEDYEARYGCEEDRR